MNNKLMSIMFVSISVIILAIFTIVYIQPPSLNNESKNYFSGEYKIMEDGTTVINNQTFFVSKSCSNNCSNMTEFHDVVFIIPSISLTNPSGFNVVMVDLLDGNNETLTLASRDSTSTVFTKHVHPQAAVTLNANGTFNFLVSTS